MTWEREIARTLLLDILTILLPFFVTFYLPACVLLGYRELTRILCTSRLVIKNRNHCLVHCWDLLV